MPQPQELDFFPIAILGAGAVGKALARALSRAGYPLTAILDKRAAVARELAAELGVARSGSDLSLIQQDTHLLIIAVPDDQISVVDKALGKLLPKGGLSACVHTSGTLPGSSLEHLAAAGIVVGSLHPLQTFPPEKQSPDFQGVFIAIEGDDAIQGLLNPLIERLGGIPIPIPSANKVSYHAAAVFASNFIPVVMREAIELLGSAGIEPTQARKMIAPLMRQSLENAVKYGETQALTGPVARGDVETVGLHLQALAAISPSTLVFYRLLSLKALELSLEKGLSTEAAERLQRTLQT